MLMIRMVMASWVVTLTTSEFGVAKGWVVLFRMALERVSDFRAYPTALHVIVGVTLGINGSHMLLIGAPSWAVPKGSVSDRMVATV